MSYFTRRYVGPIFDRERYGEIEEEANHNFEQDQEFVESDSGRRSKVISFFKGTRVTAFVKVIFSRGKTFLSRLASNQKNEDTPSPLVEKGTKSHVPTTETVTFPSYMVPARSISTIPSSQSPIQVSSLFPVPKVSPVSGNDLSQVNTDECSVFDKFRYKERSSNKMSFKEIEKGIVGTRSRWIESLLMGKKADENDCSLPVNGIGQVSSRNNTNEKPPANAVCGQKGRKVGVEQLFLGSESEKESDFDDSPRLYKHRMPEDEPQPWVEPGIVARGGLWLEPILTGRERLASIPRGEKHPSSPTRVLETRFCN